jgi:glycosyltransferase involved in cell wall biosynthesis
MKLIVQIPCLNEAETLAATLAEIPRRIEGFDTVEILIIDDGSVDDTSEVARRHGVDHLRRFSRSRGLAATFKAGLETALALGADVIVNTDGDNQYAGSDIPRLVAPILRGEADMVIGDRRVKEVNHFSFTKKKLQTLGSWVVRQVSGTKVPDTTSGFRAFSREAALRMNLVSDYTYTLETIIQAGKKRLAVAQVPIEARETRPSRLIRSNWDYVKRSAATIVRIYAMYEPLKIFSYLALAFFLPGLFLSFRYLYFHYKGESGHVQSVLLAILLLILAFGSLVFGLLADILASVRRLLEEVLYRQRRLEERLDEARPTELVEPRRSFAKADRERTR